jgi:hypothetical protein
MDITVVIRLDAAQSLQYMVSPNAASKAVLNVAQDQGVNLQPIHPGIQDLELVKYFYIQDVPEEQVQSNIKAFLMCPFVEGAYVKPEGESP